jgi:cytochrome c oxidase subunit II
VKIPSSIWTLLIGISLTLVSLWYGQNHSLLPLAASDSATLVDGLFNTMMTISTGIFLIVEGGLIYCAFRYRRRQGDNSDGPAIEGNVPLEILWTAIPAIIVIGLSVYSFDVYTALGSINPHAGHGGESHQSMRMSGSAMAATLSDKPQQVASLMEMEAEEVEKDPDMVVNITGMQYAWIFSYPESGVSSGELHLPIGKETKISMTATDVIHAFWVPEFRFKQDAIPGRQSEFRITPKTEGDYALICAELCGPYHGAMRTNVVVESQESFDNWVEEQLVASKDDLNQAIALNPADKSADDFLAPYTKEMGIHSNLLNQIHPHQ